jgi:hypothetical protein
MKTLPACLFIFLVSTCGGDGRDLPETAVAKLDLVEDEFRSALEEVCDCPNIVISRSECRAALMTELAAPFEALQCMGPIFDQYPQESDAWSVGLDCIVNSMLDMADCMRSANCDGDRVEKCTEDNQIDECPEPELSTKLSLEIAACLSPGLGDTESVE